MFHVFISDLVKSRATISDLPDEYRNKEDAKKAKAVLFQALNHVLWNNRVKTHWEPCIEYITFSVF